MNKAKNTKIRESCNWLLGPFTDPIKENFVYPTLWPSHVRYLYRLQANQFWVRLQYNYITTNPINYFLGIAAIANKFIYKQSNRLLLHCSQPNQ